MKGHLSKAWAALEIRFECEQGNPNCYLNIIDHNLNKLPQYIKFDSKMF